MGLSFVAKNPNVPPYLNFSSSFQKHNILLLQLTVYFIYVLFSKHPNFMGNKCYLSSQEFANGGFHMCGQKKKYLKKYAKLPLFKFNAQKII